MSRLNMMDTGMDMIVKMSEGNPGAVQALISLIDKNEIIDPQDAFGASGALFSLDTWEIYGTDIYILWNDKCHRDTRKLIMLMRATQLGYYPVSDLKALAADQAYAIPLDDEVVVELDAKVCERLTQFAKPEETEEVKDEQN